jgi:phosphoribosylformylglycinamidine synthase
MPETKDIDRLANNNQLTVRYVDPNTEVGAGITDESLPFPISPNGSMRNIAGICDSTGLVFGLMPHPEAIYAKWLHPDHTRGNVPGPDSSETLGQWEGEGLQIFRNAVEYIQANR